MKSSILSIDNANTGARGDCVYLPMNSDKTIFNSIDDKNASLNSEYTIPSNLASGEPKQNQICVSTSSATFVVSSSPSSQITIEPNEHNIDNIIHSNTTMELFTLTKECHNHQQQKHLWFKEHWISVTITAGIIMIFIIIIITIIIH